MDQRVAALFDREQIFLRALLPFSACHVTAARLYEEKGLSPQSVIVFLIPYYVKAPDNFSVYAASEDYHLYAKMLSERLLSALSSLYPRHRFMTFADHSPIDERHAAVIGGLGVFGKNGLLLTERYGSYQFVGEILSDAPPSLLGEASVHPIRTCDGCGACLDACPTGVLRGENADCLSAITQKKGELSEEEKRLMRKQNTAWGCDACQSVCPYVLRAQAAGTIVTPIPFFHQNLLTHFDSEMLASLDKDTFARRAFAWRGRKTAERNARILEGKE